MKNWVSSAWSKLGRTRTWCRISHITFNTPGSWLPGVPLGLSLVLTKISSRTRKPSLSTLVYPFLRFCRKLFHWKFLHHFKYRPGLKWSFYVTVYSPTQKEILSSKSSLSHVTTRIKSSLLFWVNLCYLWNDIKYMSADILIFSFGLFPITSREVRSGPFRQTFLYLFSFPLSFESSGNIFTSSCYQDYTINPWL